MIKSDNFEFLRQHDPKLYKLGALAESYFHDDPNTCLIKLRQFAELLAQLTAANAGLFESTEENQVDILRRLKREGILPLEVADLFHQIRIIGNRAVHLVQEQEDDYSEALTKLRIARKLGIWFHRTFSTDYNFRPGPFIPPSQPIEATAKLTEELDRLRILLRDTQTQAEQAQFLADQQAQALLSAEQKVEREAEERVLWEQFAQESEGNRARLQSELTALQKLPSVSPQQTDKIIDFADKAAAKIDLDEVDINSIVDQKLCDRGLEGDSKSLGIADLINEAQKRPKLKHSAPQLPRQRWKIKEADRAQVQELVEKTGLSPLLAQVLIHRDIINADLAQVYLNPESQNLPAPLTEFADLVISVELLKKVIASQDKIAICGDYDADGMTSTALLLRALRHLGANVEYAIPSRMKDGYGINQRIVQEFADTNVRLILTVDNGISAYDAIALAVELGLKVIITDHHDLPEKLPPAQAILNPKLLAKNSPYAGLAGVGVAYILAICTAQSLGKIAGLTEQLLELYTLGTIADLASLTGVNRRWLKRGLRKLPQSKLVGIQALMQMAGISEEQKQLKPDDIGFRLGPRINAIGRIGDPQVMIELLTTEDKGIALERAMQCEQINRQRQELCEQIETDAIAYIETTPISWQSDRILVIVQPHWHHGVIGIVASRLLERYGVPVFIGTFEEAEDKIRGSARGIEEFNIFEALDFCKDLLGKFGGHRAAGGFSLEAKNLEAFQQRLQEFAHQCLEPEQLKPLIKIDAQADFSQLNLELYHQIDGLQPWGMGNSFPIFWTPNVRILEQTKMGKNHLRLTLAQSDKIEPIKALAWRWGEYFPLPSPVDIAYKVQENNFNGKTSLQLEMVGVRLPQNDLEKYIRFNHQGRIYSCRFGEMKNELWIENDQGKILAIQKGQRTGWLGNNQTASKQVDITQTHYFQLIKMAIASLESY